MSLLAKGITRLSELHIDSDKDWRAMGITNLREVTSGMIEGDLVVRDANRLTRIPASHLGHVLTSAGLGHIPAWAPPPGVLETYIPVWIYLSKDESLVVVDKHTNQVLTGLTTQHIQDYEDAPADLIKRLDPQPKIANAEDLVTVDRDIAISIPIDGECAIENEVGGAVLDDGGVETDYTADINDSLTATTKLLPDAPLQVDDAFYFGFKDPWGQVRLNIHIAAVGNFMLVEEYWDGAAWSALTLLRDGTGEFRISGVNFVKWTVPGDWALTTIQGMNLYWSRFRVANVVDYSTQPYGRQAWCEILA